jgi:hypothetical protein
MSKADYRKNYWLPILRNKLNECERYLSQDSSKEKLKKNLLLLQNELKSEDLQKLSFQFDAISDLQLKKFTPLTITKLREYLKNLNRFYINLYNVANKKKDQHLRTLQENYTNKQAFVDMKKAYYNNRLAEFVKNTNDIERIIEFNNRLHQKIDPIYKNPKGKFLKAHFYAPQKRLFNSYYDTYWVNIIVIWISSISLYLILYFQLLKKLLDLFEKRKK